MKWYVELMVDSLGESLIFSIICAVAAVAGVFVLQVPFVDGLGFVLLVVSAGLMLIGGGLSFVSPGNVKVLNILMGPLMKNKANPGPHDYRSTRQKAALYSVTGVLLFAYSLVLALFVA